MRASPVLDPRRTRMPKRLARALLLLLTLVPALAQAWWNADWAYRKKLTLDAAQAGVKEGLAGFAVPVRLHTGNFLFSDAKPDGSDIRFVAADDKTPLKFHVESFDAANELAVLWVQVPKLAGSEAVWMYYGNPKAQAGSDPKGTYDPATTVALHFGERDGAPKDATAYANSPTQATATLGTAGVLGNVARFDGTQRMLIPAAPSLKLNPATGFTFSAWVKPDGPQSNALLFEQREGQRSVQVAIEGARLTARVVAAAKPVQVSAELAPGAWQHVAVALSTRLEVYVNGAAVAAADAAVPDIGGDVVIGAGFRGELDAVQLASIARSADWVRAQFDSQSPEGKLVAYGADEEAGGAGHSYLGILIDNLTLDAWIVIAILMVMLAWSFVIMILKAVFLSRTERANQRFIEQFERLSTDLTRLDHEAGGESARAAPGRKYASPFWRSPIYRVYHSGVNEVTKRLATARENGATPTLTPQSIEAIRAVLDARIVRENQRLNSQMVLLTIAISGGPFLGLLGTVVGVMIVFAAVAAAGDVNVTAIAPGVAAALLATVAGLAVAIPALFGYNWLASRIRNVQSDMQVFADELLTKLAEAYAG
jgi:biopolymer transport protein ExbB